VEFDNPQHTHLSFESCWWLSPYIIGGSWGIGDGEALMERKSEVFEGASSGGLRQAVVAALVDLHLIAKETAADSAA
jgi:hypothetical protein